MLFQGFGRKPLPLIKFWPLIPKRPRSQKSKGIFPAKGTPMKHTAFTIVLSSLMLWSCSESSSTSKKDDSSANPYTCATNPYAYGCTGATTGATAGATTGVTGGSTGTTGGGSYNTIPSDNNWQALYPSGEPTGTCSAPTGSGFALRKGTITMAGGQMYSPANPFYSMGEAEYSGAGYSHNISYFLTTANDAKSFLDTDAVLKIRVKPRPQPKPPVGKSWCFGRVTGQSSDTWGYMKLKYSVSVRAVNADGSLGPFQGTTAQTTTVNSCSPAIDFSGFAQSAPNGLVVVVHDVQSDQGCTYQQGCTAYRTVRAASCWQMDLEVAVDGTQSI